MSQITHLREQITALMISRDACRSRNLELLTAIQSACSTLPEEHPAFAILADAADPVKDPGVPSKFTAHSQDRMMSVIGSAAAQSKEQTQECLEKET